MFPPATLHGPDLPPDLVDEEPGGAVGQTDYKKKHKGEIFFLHVVTNWNSKETHYACNYKWNISPFD